MLVICSRHALSRVVMMLSCLCVHETLSAQRQPSRGHVTGSAVFRRRPEKPLEDHSLLPGPQDYDVKVPDDTGPAFSIAAKLPDKDCTDGPGPGAHDGASVLQRGPAFTMAGRHAQQASIEASPGPAAYSAPVRLLEPPPLGGLFQLHGSLTGQHFDQKSYF